MSGRHIKLNMPKSKLLIPLQHTSLCFSPVSTTSVNATTIHKKQESSLTSFFPSLMYTVHWQVLLIPIPKYLVYSKSIYFFTFPLPVPLVTYLYLAMVSKLGKTCSCFPTIYSAYLNIIKSSYSPVWGLPWLPTLLEITYITTPYCGWNNQALPTFMTSSYIVLLPTHSSLSRSAFFLFTDYHQLLPLLCL